VALSRSDRLPNPGQCPAALAKDRHCDL